jgi:hypothetical protein
MGKLITLLNKNLIIMKKIYYFLIVLITISSCKPIVMEIENDENFKNNYKFNSEIETLIKDVSEPDYQLAAAYSAAKGNHKKALEYWDLVMPPKVEDYTKEQKDSINKTYNIVQAKQYVIEQSKKSQIVIINEYHHNASHRIFTESLLVGLYKNGYRILFLEALSNGQYMDSLLNERKYPIQKSGFFTRNPQFGNLIRTALDIGFKVLPYETTQPQGGEIREIDQANNIHSIIKANPNEKYLIHCGLGHALEGNLSFFGGLSLAGRLNKLTGIDPLTIDQVYYTEKSKNEFQNPLRKALDIKEPSILLNNNVPFSYKNKESWMDIVVFHPNTSYTHKRPNWLLKDNHQFVKINLSNFKNDFPIMVMAFKEEDNIDEAVPIDIVEVTNSHDNCFLTLKKGKYKIVIINNNKKRKVFNKII